MSAKLLGAANLIDFLGATLPDKVVTKASAKAARAAGKIVKAQMIADAPVQTGTTKLAIDVRVKQYKRRRTAVAVVGARVDVTSGSGKTFRRPAKYAHLVEKGHGGPKPAPAHPFAEPAFQKTAQRATDAAADAFAKEILK